MNFSLKQYCVIYTNMNLIHGKLFQKYKQMNNISMKWRHKIQNLKCMNEKNIFLINAHHYNFWRVVEECYFVWIGSNCVVQNSRICVRNYLYNILLFRLIEKFNQMSTWGKEKNVGGYFAESTIYYTYQFVHQ